MMKAFKESYTKIIKKGLKVISNTQFLALAKIVVNLKMVRYDKSLFRFALSLVESKNTHDVKNVLQFLELNMITKIQQKRLIKK